MIGTAYNYAEFGTPNKRATYICKMHKARVLANYYYWNKLFKVENITDEEPFVLNLSNEEIEFITGGDKECLVAMDRAVQQI